MISNRTKMLEKQIVKDFIKLFKLKYQKHWYANRLIKTVSEGARRNGAYRCGLIKGVADFLFDYPKYNISEESVATILKGGVEERYDRSGNVYLVAHPTPDIIKTIKYRNLWIEFKAGKNKQTEEQIQFQKSREEDGSKYIICYSAEDAISQIKEYLGE